MDKFAFESEYLYGVYASQIIVLKAVVKFRVKLHYQYRQTRWCSSCKLVNGKRQGQIDEEATILRQCPVASVIAFNITQYAQYVPNLREKIKNRLYFLLLNKLPHLLKMQKYKQILCLCANINNE